MKIHTHNNILIYNIQLYYIIYTIYTYMTKVIKYILCDNSKSMKMIINEIYNNIFTKNKKK